MIKENPIYNLHTKKTTHIERKISLFSENKD